jgi:hypothetical protein
MAYDQHYAQCGLGARSQHNKQQYAERHSYQLIVDTNSNLHDRKPGWLKVALAANHLHRFDWIMYVDTDTIIMNHDIALQVYHTTTMKLLVSLSSYLLCSLSLSLSVSVSVCLSHSHG